MLPVGPLMIEHRLIERMIKLMGAQAEMIENAGRPDRAFVGTAVDFFKNFTDQLHHGKEENILFRDLSNQQLTSEHKRIMDELIQEHDFARSIVKKLAEAQDRYLLGEQDRKNELAGSMKILVDFYPKHIEKEDKHFFLPVMNYFSKDEQAAMLNEFNDFDRKFSQRHYQDIVSALDGKKPGQREAKI